MTKKTIFILLLIIALAAFLRCYQLSELPPSLNWDEVSISYNAYSILKTGRDDWGSFLPLANFRAYGDYPLPLYMYLVIPFIYISGLTEGVVRLPSAILGSLTVPLIYILARQVFKKNNFALLAALLFAVSPWSILTSRQVIQSTPAVFFLTLGIWLMLKGVAGRGVWLNIGVFSLGLSAYAYHNTRILAPVLFISFLVILKKQLPLQKLLAPLITAAVFFIPLIWIITLGPGSARSAWVGILDQGAINSINEARGKSLLPQPLPALLNNKISYTVKTVGRNYLGYFNPLYLGWEGGTQYQFSVPHMGIVYPLELLFFYAGLIFLLIRFRKAEAEKKYLLVWLLLSPVPAAITRDSYQVVRSSVMMPVFYLITAYGLGELSSLVKKESFKRILAVIFLCGLTFFTVRYLYNLWYLYPKEYSFAWQYGYKQVAGFLYQEGSNYDRIVVTKKYGEPHEFLLFYLKVDPYSYQNAPNLVRYEKSHWYWVDQFNEYSFVNDWEIKNRLYTPNTLLITSPKNYPPSSEVIKTIDFLNGAPAFDVVVVK